MSEPNFEFPALRDSQAKLDAARKQLADWIADAGPEMDMSKVKGFSNKDDALGAMRTKNEELEGLKKEVEGYKNLARFKANAEDGSAEKSDADPVSYKRMNFEDHLAKSIPFMLQNKGRTKSLDIELKTDFTRSAGWDPFDPRDSRVELTPLRPAVHVANYIPQGTINASNYLYMEETTHTATNTVETAEAGTYGEAAFALTQRSQTVEKIAAFVPVTDEQLEDVPAAAGYLRDRLTQQIQRRLDSQLLLGNGTTPNILGTESVSGIQTQAKGSDSIMDAARKLFTKFKDDGFAEPSVAFIAPSKWQDVVLTKTADGQYIWGHPSMVGPATLWGVPVVETTAHTSTKLIAGDYATFSRLFIRRGMDVQVSNSHASFFITGKQAVRADIRVVMVHYRPKAFGTVTGL